MKRFTIALCILILCFVAVVCVSCKRISVVGTAGSTTGAGTTGESGLTDESTNSGESGTTTESTTEESESFLTTFAETTVNSLPENPVITVAGSEIYNGTLIDVSASNPYCYRITSLYTPSELDKLSSSSLGELGWTSLYSHKNGKYLLRNRLLFLKTEAYDAFNLMMQTYASYSGNLDVQVRYAYQAVSGTKDSVSLADERITGYVVELNVYTDDGTFSIEHASKKTLYYDWFSSNCHKFGFIMTGESGYFRYVGIPHATYIFKNNLTLAKYNNLLKEYSFENPLCFVDAAGTEWKVYYKKAGNGQTTPIEIPDGYVYGISGNNCDGYIVSAKEK